MTLYLRPKSLAEALAARQEHPEWEVIAGGTDLMVGIKEQSAPVGLIDIFALPELSTIVCQNSVVRIGAAVPYAAIRQSDPVRSFLPSLVLCIREIGAVQIQARGTLGGNLATSSPVGDTLPVLLALDAHIRLASANAERVVPYDSFCTGYRQTAMKPDELIAAIEIPVPKEPTSHYWRKVGTRRAQAISKVAVAAAAQLDPHDGRVTTCRLAMAAVADRPIRLPPVEALLTGELPSTALADLVQAEVKKGLAPIDDLRSSADYRLLVAANLARRFVLSLPGA